jgi:dTMP kinase
MDVLRNEASGKFIVFEGIDGSGKTTQINLLSAKLNEAGLANFITKEPTDNEIGLLIRRYLRKELTTNRKSIAALFAADRLDHILSENGLLNILREKKIVLCDRYYLSSLAYQSGDDGEDSDWIMEINKKSRDTLRPDLCVFIDITPETAINRITKRGDISEIYERLDYLKTIRQNYLNSITRLKTSENIAIINGEKNCGDVFRDVWETVSELL